MWAARQHLRTIRLEKITMPNSESRKISRIRIYRFDATGLLPLDNAVQPFEGAPCGWCEGQRERQRTPGRKWQRTAVIGGVGRTPANTVFQHSAASRSNQQ